MNIITIVYKTSAGKEPFSEWYLGLDRDTRYTITARLKRVRLGNLGDCKILKGAAGVWELRIDYGPGYRVYFGRQGDEILVLLAGGSKGSQERDIEKAKQYWINHKETKK